MRVYKRPGGSYAVLECSHLTKNSKFTWHYTGVTETVPLTESSPKGPTDPGDQEEEYAELREALTRSVKQVCPSWLSDRSEDIVQASMIRVMEIKRRSEGKREFASSYLWRVAYSALVDEIRRLRRRREIPLEDESGEAPWPYQDASPEEVAAGIELGKLIQDCLGRLITPRRRAVTLYLLGHTVPEAARLLGWNNKRTENLVYRGLENLRDCLKSKGLKP